MTLENWSGNVDWGMTVHGPQGIYYTKDSMLLGGMSWLAPPGESEVTKVMVTDTDYHCIAVWKSGPADLSEIGEYRLIIGRSATDVPDTPAVPARTALRSVHPNPFNPRTTISFDLARDDEVTVEIYNLRGEKVRALAAERMSAGRHALVWNGLDDRGRQVVSGVYAVKLRTSEVSEVRKVTLAK